MWCPPRSHRPCSSGPIPGTGVNSPAVRIALLVAQQLGGFGPEAVKPLSGWRMLVHPPDRLLVRGAGLLLIAELPLGHRQDELGVAVILALEFKALLERCSR